MDSPPYLVIVGVGLIGGSIGMALKQAGWNGSIAGVDRPQILEEAITLQAIDEAVPELEAALSHADIVVLATPVSTIVDLLPRIAAAASDALVTDTGSTKRAILAAAAAAFGDSVERRFLGGHPLAGREHGSIMGADPRLFSGQPWVLAAGANVPIAARSPRHAQWLGMLELMGARLLQFDAERHDQVMAWLSHLPQLLSTALGGTLYRRFLERGGHEDELQAGGSGVRDMVRLAASPYPLWRDILLTNADAIELALHAFQQELDHLRLNLRTREIETLFHEATEACTYLRQSPRRPGGGF